jgi:molybdopterin molybdotransferase
VSRGLAWDVARERAAGAAPAPATEHVPLHRAVGRVLAEDVQTPIPLPHYASSAMDGWAVRGASPWRLVDGPEPGQGEAVVIVTGGLVPASAGEVVLEAGAVLTPPRVALAAATGADRLTVRRRPRVVLVLTGDEVVESGVPEPGRVRDSFRLALPAILHELGAETIAVHRVGDDPGATADAITADHVDLVVTTGGTGGSHADQVRVAVEGLGAEVLVPSVAMRPGGPTFLARLPDRVVLGLPGNPLASMLGLLAIGGPLLAAWTGHASEPTSLVVGEALAGTRGATRLVPAAVHDGVATPTGHAGSGMLRGLAAADAVLVVPESGVEHGTSAAALRLPWRT